jgi:hypothetical protein
LASDPNRPPKRQIAQLRRALRARAGKIPPSGDIYSYLFALADPDQEAAHLDRMIAIIGSTYIELGLEQAILTHFTSTLPHETKMRIFRGESDGPAVLTDFYAKIELAYMLGIITEEARDDLHTIRAVRNAFAHSALPLDFSTPEVAALLKHIHMKIEIGATAIFDMPFFIKRKMIYYSGNYHFRLWTYHHGGPAVAPLP